VICSHIVPQLLLKRFASEPSQHGKLRELDRADLHSWHPTTVRKACREGGYYQIEAEDLEEWAREGHDPEIAEKALGRVEGEAGALVDGLIAGKLPRTDADRLHLALFVAVQMTRGWQFHEEMNQFRTLQMRQELQDRRDEGARRCGGIRERSYPAAELSGHHAPHHDRHLGVKRVVALEVFGHLRARRHPGCG
jgi:Protein of unknown function (DUF4238)